MKVGILTYHASINPGAFWQCFATCQALRALHHDPIILDYRNPKYHPRNPWAAFGKPQNWLCPLQTFLSSWCRFRRRNDLRFLPLGEPLEPPSVPQDMPLDAIVIGSDVVWRAPFDPVYFGQSLRAPRMVAYAVSMGETNSSSSPVPPFLLDRSPFAAISCRDSNTLSFLAKGHPSWHSGARIVNDPTVTLAVPETFRKGNRIRRPYCMLYHAGRIDASGMRALRRMVERRRLDLLSVFYPHRRTKSLPYVSAVNWMHLLLNSSLVVTDTFHGAVIARLHGVPVVFVSRNGDLPLKMRDQFQSLALSGCIADRMEDLSAAMDQTTRASDIREIRPALEKENMDFLENLFPPRDQQPAREQNQ